MIHGLLFTSDGQKQAGSWCTRHTLMSHTCWACSWRHRHKLPETNAHDFATFKHWFSDHQLTENSAPIKRACDASPARVSFKCYSWPHVYQHPLCWWSVPCMSGSCSPLRENKNTFLFLDLKSNQFSTQTPNFVLFLQPTGQKHDLRRLVPSNQCTARSYQ